MALLDFLLNTDYPIEKVVAYKEGSFSATTSFTSVQIPHGLPFTPLPYIQWSFTPDFSVPNEVTQGFSDMYTASYPYVTRAYANTSNFIFDFFVDTTMTSMPKTVYYRMYGFEPTDSGGGEVEATAGLSGLYNFLLNTDLNYLRIFNQDKLVVASTKTISHNLGYRPTVMVWEEVNDATYGQVTCPTINNVLYDQTGMSPLAASRVGINDITFTRAGTYHYRIYV